MPHQVSANYHCRFNCGQWHCNWYSCDLNSWGFNQLLHGPSSECEWGDSCDELWGACSTCRYIHPLCQELLSGRHIRNRVQVSYQLLSSGDLNRLGLNFHIPLLCSFCPHLYLWFHLCGYWWFHGSPAGLLPLWSSPNNGPTSLGPAYTGSCREPSSLQMGIFP